MVGSSMASCRGASLGSMMLSAPLLRSLTLPSGLRTSTLMRLRSDVKSSVSSTSTRSSTFPGCPAGASLVAVWRMAKASWRSWKLWPKYAAAQTRASSSGEAAESLIRPSTLSGMTVWHSASVRKKVSMSSACASPAPPLRSWSMRGSWKETCSKLSSLAILSASRSSADGALPSSSSAAFPISVEPLPYSTPPTEHLRKSMTLHVSVPVLSLKMCEICPSSSLSVMVRTIMGVSEASWYMSRSRFIK
mmetsp:Transcript_16349/g.55526  ORF Transcript_16349/g.55526 Transcript_16349/m.55526 type:complete len:248 (+) Transcript_16349:292-1035(+)